jgi:hypothetical protein
MISKVKLKLASVLFIILIMQLSPFAYAQGEEQSASPGTQGQKPLNLTSVTLAGGGNVQDAADISTEPKFILQFDKNVVNSLIWEVNSKCVSLVSQGNKNIPVTVTKADDTIDFTQRQNIFVQPISPLRPGTSYYLKISPELKAKSGATLGEINAQGLSITFKTGGEAPVQPSRTIPASSAPPVSTANTGTPDDLSSMDTQLAETKPAQPQVPANTPVATEDSMPDLANKPQETTSSLAGWTTTTGVFLIAGWIVFEILLKRKRKI